MGFTDMRNQINGLARIAEAKKPKELLSGNYFVFLGKTRRVMKIHYESPKVCRNVIYLSPAPTAKTSCSV